MGIRYVQTYDGGAVVIFAKSSDNSDKRYIVMWC